MTKVLVIEDHEITRDGINTMLQKSGDLQLVGSTGTGKEGIQLAREKLPDVVVLDYQLPDTNGLEVTRKLLSYRRDVKILIVTANTNDTLVLKLFEAGAAGYLSKKHGFHELDRAIRSVKHGQRYISSDMANTLALRKIETNAHTPFDELNAKEMEVALLIANGLSVAQAAKQLHIAPKTIRSYRSRIFKKLNIKTDLALLQLALQYRVVEIDSAPLSKDPDSE